MLPGERGAGRGAKSRTELTSIAIDCFARYGFQGTSIDRIASIAGVTKGAIYYHFRDKDDLLEAAVRDRIAEFENRVQNACAGLGPADALRRIAEVCIDHAEAGDHSRFVISMSVEAIDTNAEVSDLLRDMMRRFRSFLRNVVRNAQENGEFSKDVDADTIAAGYTGAVLGAEIQYYQDPESFDLRVALLPSVDRMIASMACKQVETEGA